MLRPFLFTMMACTAAWALEGFESAAEGALSNERVQYGTLKADAGHAEVIAKHARQGKKCLRIAGGSERQVTLNLSSKVEKSGKADFWLGRWSREGDFKLTVSAISSGGVKPLTSVTELNHGGYQKKVSVELPGGTTGLLISCTSPEKGGALIDDIGVYTGKMKVESISMVNPGVYPIMKRASFNPAVGIQLVVEGASSPQQIRRVRFKVDSPRSVEKVTLRTGDAQGMNFAGSEIFGTGEPDKKGFVSIPCKQDLPSGETMLWLDVTPSEKALVGSTLTISDVSVAIGKKSRELAGEPVTQRIGYMLGFPGENVKQKADGQERPCVAFRIPGLIQTQKGTLIGCFDARYTHEGDLCADIDVAVVRSTDGGQTWTKPEVALDAGPGHANGCGDPCILQDKKGRIWMQALATHFARGRAINASRTGTSKEDTGQWEMVCSTDEGKTWGDIINVTEQVKKNEWNLILAGPGNGITLKDGTIVFPAQIWQHNATPNCRSTICYSKDGGKNWKFGTGVPHKTSECQVVELKDGSIMINCRNEAYGGRRIVYVTKDLGETWEAHETNSKALSEPTCQASIVSVKTKKYGPLLLFSNPKINGRSNMTIRTSRDDGKTWNEGYLYDVRRCMGYSCIAMTDDDHVGIIYETCHTNGLTGNRGIGFLRIPLETVVTGREVAAESAQLGEGRKKAKKGKKGKKGKKKSAEA